MSAGDAVGTDSSGVTTTRNETTGVYNSESKKTRRKKYGKYPYVLGPQIVLSALYTRSNIHDVITHAG